MIRDLTEGRPQIMLWKFSIPMFVSVIFQQTYNIADSIIAGRFAGESALAAIGASYPITMIFMAFAVGSNIGCCVLISMLFGAKEYDDMKTAVSTTLYSSFAISALLTLIGLICSGTFMTLIHTPNDIFDSGNLYLRIYTGGFMFLFLYNVSTGIFSALGDSKTPLYFLIGSSIGNIILDYIFVAQFKLGVAGVAWATFIAQGVACILALVTLKGRMAEIKTTGNTKRFSFDMFKKICDIAIPSILQQSFISIGNIFIQGIINAYGSSVIAGYSAAVKLNTFTITSFTTLGNGVSTFTAQNLGAGKIERVKKGFIASVQMALMVAVPFFVLFFVLPRIMVGFFMPEGSEAAMQTGMDFLRIVSPFYFVIPVKLLADGVLRGAGAMKEFMIATFSDLILRVILAFILPRYMGVSGVWWSWPIGWIVGTLISFVFYKSGCWKKLTEE